MIVQQGSINTTALVVPDLYRRRVDGHSHTIPAAPPTVTV